jgi:hypothetical protein
MRLLALIFLFLLLDVKAQDKIFFREGKSKEVILISIGKELVYYKDSISGPARSVQKNKLVMIEDHKGQRYIYAPVEDQTGKRVGGAGQIHRNILGCQPFALIFGRATLVYERLNEKGNIGYVIPFSLTFDPYGSSQKQRIDTTAGANRVIGINFIIGADINFYLGQNDRSRFFIGPRFRYGTDVFLRNIEGYSYQTQIGWKFHNPGGIIVQHFSMGFGFVKLLSTPSGAIIDPRQAYAWYSINYRVGFNW